MYRLWLASVVVWSGCYRPAPGEGAPCNMFGECPFPLRCQANVCVAEPGGDAAAGDAPGDPDAGDDAPLDAPTTCATPPMGNFGTPTINVALTSSSFEGTATVSSDGLELYFKTDRAGGVGGSDQDIWRATRTSIAAAWGALAAVPGINSTGHDEAPELSSDGLTLWFTSARAPNAGGSDIWVTTRASKTAAWGTPSRVAELSTAGRDEGIFVMPSMLVAYVGSDLGNSSFDFRLYRSTRASLTDAWSTPVRVQGLPANMTTENPWLTPDECALYVHIGDAGGDADLYVLRRATPSGAWGAPIPIANLNSTSIDADPWLTSDERYILFTSERAGGFDFYQASR